jgi:glycosyltransferase involved in cell wall biosynthesis
MEFGNGRSFVRGCEDEQASDAGPPVQAPVAVPTISIVLPVHNGEAYLAQAIESVLGQTCADFELICVDDGSTDRTPEILERFAKADPRIRIVTNRPNRGLPGALNAGFAVARGAFHSWTSDDNLLRPHMLETLLAALNGHPEAGIAHAHYSLIDATGRVTGHQRVGPADEILLGNRIGAAFLYRAEVSRLVRGYDEALFGVEDYDFWLRAARVFGFVTVDEDLYLYRRHQASLTGRKARTIHRLTRQIIERELRFVGDRRTRAAVLLEHGLASWVEPRLGMIARATALAPGKAIARAPAIAQHVLRHAARAIAERAAYLRRRTA